MVHRRDQRDARGDQHPVLRNGAHQDGRQAHGGPPAYQPRVVADAILYAAENAPRDIVAGGAGKQMLLGQRLSPRMMDAFMLRAAFGTQQTDESKGPDAPNALFGPVEGHGKAQADLNKTVSRSLQVWLDTHPAMKRGVLAALGAAVLLAARAAVRS
ncbi:MAG TPA: hypothetical protein VKA51_08265 [Rubrobacteraceae bacterium]|nr:hypothetical protein [Rubrobacteraceae bacterium]